MPEIKDRTGETRIMNNGLSATIIRYENSNDIDLQFDNGQIVLNRTYRWFRLGKIRCPSIVEYIDDYAKITNVNVIPNFSFIVDVEDVPLVKDNVWFDNGNGYAKNNKLGYAHRLVMNAPDDMDIDHFNHDGFNCRKSNLRVCAHSSNMYNTLKRKDNTSGYKGVYWHNQRQKWGAQIHVNGKNISLGLHMDKLDAARAYNYAAVRYFSDYANLNPISDEDTCSNQKMTLEPEWTGEEQIE